MAKRRAKGDGSIVKVGDRWAAVLEFPRKSDGSRDRRWARTATKDEARKALRKMQDERERYNGRRQSVLLTDLLELEFSRITEASARTRNSKTLERAIEYFGDVDANDLEVAQCDAFLKALAEGELGGKPLARDTVSRARAFLIAAVADGMRTGRVETNAFALSRMPTKFADPIGKRALTAVEWKKLYGAADDRLKVVLDLCGRHGLRPQEARALEWSDIDFNKGLLSVAKQMSSSDKQTGAKTADSYRIVSLRSDTLKHLKSLSQEHKLILATSNGTPWSQGNMRRSLVTLCEKVGVERIVPYSLRHTALTFQIDSGATAIQAAAWAGTSVRMIETRYHHRLSPVSSLSPIEFG